MKRLLTISNLRLAVEIVLIIVLLPLALSSQATTQAAAPQAPDTLGWYQCNGPNHVGLFSNRVHIYCSSTTPVGSATALSANIFWFAVPTAPDSAQASRYMSLLQTSVITGRLIWLEADPNDTSGTSFGCGSTDCRRIYGMEMR